MSAGSGSGGPSGASGTVAAWGHLARRFAGSLRPGRPGPDEQAWVRGVLGDGEWALWRRMNGPDQRHAVAVAHRVAAELGPDATRPVLAAALLHDVGKLRSGLRTPGRVAATLVERAGGRSRARVWSAQPGYRGRVGRYLRHDVLGAELLVAAGADPLTVTWAAEHHRPPERWTLPPEVAAALKAADDD